MIPIVRPALLVESVALIPCGAVLRPGTHADPAKLPFALLARHVADCQLAPSE
jgi:hypothetical protein